MERDPVLVLLGRGGRGHGSGRTHPSAAEPGPRGDGYATVGDFWDATPRVRSRSGHPTARWISCSMAGYLPDARRVCRLWARTAFSPGRRRLRFRDSSRRRRPHDFQALLPGAIYCGPPNHQFVEGDVQHWVASASGGGVRTRSRTIGLVAAYAVDRYISLTGRHGGPRRDSPPTSRVRRCGRTRLTLLPAGAFHAASFLLTLFYAWSSRPKPEMAARAARSGFRSTGTMANRVGN